jgi:hypothetical protein
MVKGMFFLMFTWFCAGNNGSSVSVLVMSRLGDLKQRNGIRSTWAAGRNNVRFVVGRPCAETADYKCKRAANGKAHEFALNAVSLENATHNDIIMTSQPESYRGLPAKLKDAYAASLDASSASTWFCKIDDDSFVRLTALEQFLENVQRGDVKPMVVGRIDPSYWVVHRSGKWAERNYKPDMYPPYPIGSFGHCVTRPVAQFIVDNRIELFNYQGEDVSVGIWLHNAPLHVQWVSTNRFFNHGGCGSSEAIIIGHKIDVSTMKRCQGSS